jgi:hypothetical protein
LNAYWSKTNPYIWHDASESEPNRTELKKEALVERLLKLEPNKPRTESYIWHDASESEPNHKPGTTPANPNLNRTELKKEALVERLLKREPK